MATSKKPTTKAKSSVKKAVTKTSAAKAKTPTKTANTQWLSNTVVMWLLQLIGGVLWSRWWLAVIILYVIQKDTFTAKDMKTFNNIINFNLSFLLYAIVSAVLIIVFIGMPLLMAVCLTYIVLLIISSVNYIMDKPYDIPLSIQILK